jgi:hypothetical protein
MALSEWKKTAETNAGNDSAMNALMDRIIADQEALGDPIV